MKDLYYYFNFSHIILLKSISLGDEERNTNHCGKLNSEIVYTLLANT